MRFHLHSLQPACPQARSRADACDAPGTRHLIPLFAGLLAALLLFVSQAASAVDVAVRVDLAPPSLPVYEQPALPAEGYIWIPGYWSYGPEGYFWVPGTWTLPPDPDLV